MNILLQTSSVYTDLEGELTGTLTDILQTGANDVYEIKLEDNRLIYVPAIKDSNIEVDLSAGCIKLHVLPGLVD